MQLPEAYIAGRRVEHVNAEVFQLRKDHPRLWPIGFELLLVLLIPFFPDFV
jgi:hypothetical protein